MAFDGPGRDRSGARAAQPVTEVLAAATARTLNYWRRRRGQQTRAPLLALETHGRADTVTADADTSDTVGLLSAIYPLRVPRPTRATWSRRSRRSPVTASTTRCCGTCGPTPPNGSGSPDPQVLLNYLGRIHLGAGGDALRPDRALLANVSPLPEPNLAVRHELTINAAVVDRDGTAVLGTQWRTLPEILSGDDVATLQAMWQDALREVPIERAEPSPRSSAQAPRRSRSPPRPPSCAPWASPYRTSSPSNALGWPPTGRPAVAGPTGNTGWAPAPRRTSASRTAPRWSRAATPNSTSG